VSRKLPLRGAAESDSAVTRNRESSAAIFMNQAQSDEAGGGKDGGPDDDSGNAFARGRVAATVRA
jgi:hypothetical protein